MGPLRLRRLLWFGTPLAAVVMAFVWSVTASSAASAQASQPHKVKSLEIRILSTMLADEGFGEWGFAALVEVDGRRILFDTGANEDTVQRNLKVMKLDLSNVEHVILSHQGELDPGRSIECGLVLLAGWTVGAAWALLCWLTARWLQRKGEVEPPTAETLP